MAGEEEVWGRSGALEGQGLEKFPLFSPRPDPPPHQRRRAISHVCGAACTCPGGLVFSEGGLREEQGAALSSKAQTRQATNAVVFSPSLSLFLNKFLFNLLFI